MRDGKRKNSDNQQPILFEDVVDQLKDASTLDPKYLEIDVYPNALDSLRQTYFFLTSFKDSMRWKWATIAIVSSLYHFMICALVGGNYERVIDFSRLPKKVKEKLEMVPKDDTTVNYLRRREIIEEFLQSGSAKLISFDVAMERIQDKHYMRMFTPSTIIEISKREIVNIKELRQTFRNQFEHYRPVGWVIRQELFIPLMHDTLKVIERLLNNFNMQLFNMRHGRAAFLYLTWNRRALGENLVRIRNGQSEN